MCRMETIYIRPYPDMSSKVVYDWANHVNVSKYADERVRREVELQPPGERIATDGIVENGTEELGRDLPAQQPVTVLGEHRHVPHRIVGHRETFSAVEATSPPAEVHGRDEDGVH